MCVNNTRIRTQLSESTNPPCQASDCMIGLFICCCWQWLDVFLKFDWQFAPLYPPRYLEAISFVFPLMLMLAWVLFVADFVKKLVHERELRLHEVMLSLSLQKKRKKKKIKTCHSISARNTVFLVSNMSCNKTFFFPFLSKVKNK